MNILGINGGFRPGYQDVSACLVKDGKVIAAIEEERLSRIKFSAGRLPYLSVLEVLKIAKLKIEDIAILAFHGSSWETEIEKRITDYCYSISFLLALSIIKYGNSLMYHLQLQPPF